MTRGGHPVRSSDPATIELGREPPLVIGDTPAETVVRRSVSWRWLTGTVLTGLTSTILMGGALTAALDGRHELASVPEAQTRSTDSDLALANGKGDRIRLSSEPAPEASRQIIQVSTISRQGDRDHVKLVPFAKVEASLALRTTELSAKVPAYDPIKIFAENAEAADDSTAEETNPNDLAVIDDEAGSSGDSLDGETEQAPGAYVANVDGEVAVKVSDFPFEGAELEQTASYDIAEVEETVRGMAGREDGGNTEMAALPYVDAERFNFDDASSDPFSALGVRIIPENVSFVTKNTAGSTLDEHVVTLDRRGGLDDVLADQNITAADTDRILSALSELVDLARLEAGETVRIAFLPVDSEDEAARPMRVSIYSGGVHQATVARRDDGSFVRSDEPEAPAPLVAGDETSEPAAPAGGQAPNLYEAIYETALEQSVPQDVIRQLVRIFSYDVDFQQRARPGDSLEVFHAVPDGEETAGEDEVLYAALTVGGVPKRFYRFRTPDDGYTDFYDEEGKSAKKFLMRKPMNGGILRSTFGYRRHPILGYKRLHAGVDWAAPRGTPILAAGNGTVEKAGWSSGYGRFTLVRHANGYETAYAHQSAIAKGIVPGAKVRQGQVIGYVGSTGLSTGAHLHYEVRVNRKPVDPLRIRLPRGRVLQGDLLANFERERNRIDALIGNTPSQKVASVD
nr:M23 family metallopeptidase [Prosthecomicrobium pneumaticum]